MPLQDYFFNSVFPPQKDNNSKKLDFETNFAYHLMQPSIIF